MLNTILVAIDDSAASRRAFTTALELAQALSARLILVHALDIFDPASPERPAIAATSYSVALDETLRQTYEQRWSDFVEHFDALLRQKQGDADAAGVKASYVQPYGRPGPTICGIAHDCEADLIVVGSRDRSGLRELVLGSVSSYLMHRAPCSVLVVHAGDRHHGAAASSTQATAPSPR